jgi:hypothetical protein
MQPTWSDVLAAIENMLQTPEARSIQPVFALWLSHAVKAGKENAFYSNLSPAENLRSMFTRAITLTTSKEDKLTLLLVLQYVLAHVDEICTAANSISNFSWPMLTPEEKCDLAYLGM